MTLKSTESTESGQGHSPHARVRFAVHRLSRGLACVTGVSQVGQVIVRHMTRAVDAHIGTLAMVDRERRQLVIVATHGYAGTVIEDRRIALGSGVLGSVYQSGIPLWVTDASLYPGMQRRPRYRTNSFVALPISAGSEVLAVVSVTDRADDREFTRDDLWTLRALAAPATLALSRERAQTAATTNARAAAIDPLSGLYNRRYFEGRIEEELQRAGRQQTQVALLMSDLDDFKAINDAYGHAVGDAAIRDIAEILRQSVRVFDVCTRFGGEEFAIVMPGSSAESATATAERIRQRIEAHRMAEPYPPPRMTVSVGVAASEPHMTASELILRADQALYAAKRAGRNLVRTFIAEPCVL